MNRREFLALSAAAAAGSAFGCGRFPRSGRRGLNLVMVVSDALRADHLGCYGSSLSLSPALDELARRGTLFTEMMSSAPLTGASHATIMTGTYQTRHTVTDNAGRIPDGLSTLAQVCQSRQRRTAAFVSNINLTSRYLSGIERGFDLYDSKLPAEERNRPKQLYRNANDTAEAALSWLRRQADDPFFLWVHFMEPHGPYEVNDPALLGEIPAAPSFPGEPTVLPVLPGNEGPGGIPAYQVLGEERNPLEYHRRYAARVRYMDGYFRKLMEEIRRSGLEENTYICFLSDHGELLGKHGYYFQHGITLLRGVLHVPFIVAGPGVPQQKRITLPVSNADIMPTALELLGLGSAVGLQGRSLVPLLKGTELQPAPIYALARQDREWAVRVGRFKYTAGSAGSTGRDGLFDMDADPGETHEIGRQFPKETAELANYLRMFKLTNPTVLDRPVQAPPAMTPEEIERLKSLGYL